MTCGTTEQVAEKLLFSCTLLIGGEIFATGRASFSICCGALVTLAAV